MTSVDMKEIRIVEDTVNDMDIITDIINIKDTEDAFYIVDIGDVIKRHLEWIAKIPRVIPHYAIKCNPNNTVIQVLAALNACFDCASKQEIEQVMQYGVHGERIIFAHPAKYPSHIKYAKKAGVEQMTVDSEIELLKIKEFFPEAKVVIRIRCDANNSTVSLGEKFGCECEETVRLIQLTKDLNLNLHGFSFHVGTPCNELDAYRRGIIMCKQLIVIAKSIGCEDAQLIDIGGGFVSEFGAHFDEFAKIINSAVKDIDSNIRIISEPGRYYVHSNFTLASYLHSKKIVFRDGEMKRMYYMSCGVYNSFLDKLLQLSCRSPTLLSEPKDKEKFSSTLWGPTLDSSDLIIENIPLPELCVGDWLVWKNMGAYTLSVSNTFNGFPIPVVIPFIRKSQWKDFRAHINAT